MPLHVAVVQPEDELIDIPAKMLWIDVVINAMQPALENTPNALDVVGAHAVADILTRRVLDRLVLVEWPTPC